MRTAAREKAELAAKQAERDAIRAIPFDPQESPPITLCVAGRTFVFKVIRERGWIDDALVWRAYGIEAIPNGYTNIPLHRTAFVSRAAALAHAIWEITDSALPPVID
jgi:hypothetical protein